MDIRINQKQSRELLQEHAEFSFNYFALGRNELYVAIALLVLGVLISITSEQNRLTGIPFIAIGIFELIKYPSREQRWIKKKEKESKFNKILEFEISKDRLKITIDKKSNSYSFSIMRKCLISEKGILFKVSKFVYYYISFKSMPTDIDKDDLIGLLKNGFESNKIVLKEKQNEG